MSAPAGPGIAVLGSGAIARSHVAALARTGTAHVTHVLAADHERAAAVAALAPGARPSTQLDSILADPATQGVYVCGRTDDHIPRARAAIAAGKHVIIEKPPARRLRDFDALTDDARRVGVRLMVGQTVRFQPAISTLARDAAAGGIGVPRVLHLNWYVGHVWPGAWTSWQLDPRRSGGHLVHNGMHPLDLAIWLLGARPVRVFTRGWCTHAPDMPTPDSFHVSVRFDTGALALLEVSYGLRTPGDVLRRTVLYGTSGTLRHHTDDDARFGGAPVPPASVADAIDHQARHAVDVIAGRTEPLVTLEQSRSALAAALAAQRSLETGRPVALEEVEDD